MSRIISPCEFLFAFVHQFVVGHLWLAGRPPAPCIVATRRYFQHLCIGVWTLDKPLQGTGWPICRQMAVDIVRPISEAPTYPNRASGRARDFALWRTAL